MKRRPLSLTIIGWFLIVTGLFGLFGALTIGSNEIALRMINDTGMSIRTQQVMGVLGCLVCALCAYGIFTARPWSRVVYVGFGIVSLLVNLLTSPALSMTIFSALFVAVIAFFLFRPTADEWFEAKGLQLQRNNS